jgi:hypothetical protein
MTQLPPDDKQWKEFLQHYCPAPPPAAANFEERLMKAVEQAPHPFLSRRLWALPPALVAGLLMTWSGYRTLVPIAEPSNSATVEAFLEDNWNGVVGTTPVSLQGNNPQADWLLSANAAP